MSGVIVYDGSQSHNFGPLNLLARLLKKPHLSDLAHNSILPHIPSPSPALFFYSQLILSSTTNDIHSYFTSYFGLTFLITWSISRNFVCDTSHHACIHVFALGHHRVPL